MKKILLATLLFCMVTSVFAAKVSLTPKSVTKNEMIHWKFITAQDGYSFVLPEDRSEYFVIKNNTTVNGKSSDPVTVFCNAQFYRLNGGESVSCYGNWEDMNSFSIAPEDVKNGAEGTFEYVDSKK